jgi:hypothetical protein
MFLDLTSATTIAERLGAYNELRINVLRSQNIIPVELSPCVSFGF